MSTSWPPSQVAIVYDRVNTRHGGAEQVLLALQQIFPQADLITAVADLQKATWAKKFSQVKTSWLQYFPGAAQNHRWLAQFMPLAFESFNLRHYDLVISVSSAEAKGVLTIPNQLHVSYVLAPPRYLYHQQVELLKANPITSLPGIYQLAKKLLKYLTWWDQVAIFRPDVLIPLSLRVTKQLQTYYHLTSHQIQPVLYPPIVTQKTYLAATNFNVPTSPFFLQVGRLVAYKRADLSLKAAAKANLSIIIVGVGPEKANLVRLIQQLQPQTSAQLTLIGAVSAPQLQALYQNCSGVLIPGAEDFGLTALEANAAGKPVIIYQAAGAAEVIKPQRHGLLLKNQTVSELAQAMQSLLKHVWEPQLLRQNAAKYDTSIFTTELIFRLKLLWKHHQSQLKTI